MLCSLQANSSASISISSVIPLFFLLIMASLNTCYLLELYRSV